MRRGRFAGRWLRPRTVWSLVAALAFAGAIVWLSWPRNTDDRDEAAAAAITAPVARDVVRALETARNEEADAAPASALPSGRELVEVCGVGWVEADASGALDVSAVVTVPDVVASQRALLESIRQSDGELGAAIATVLELHGAAREDHGPAPATALLCTGADCASRDADRQLASGLVEQLAKQATTTLDGHVYALAMNACAPVAAQGSCALLNVEQWAHLDSGNAVPWLHLLQRARQRNDAAQVEEALYRIGTAERFEDRPFAISGSIADHAGSSDVDTMAAQLLAVEALATNRPLPYNALMAVCTGAAFADANRRQACNDAATTLAERSDSLMALAIGTSIGRRLGWPDDRVDALRGLQFASAEMARASDTGAESPSPADVPSTCGGARRVLALLSHQARAGEVQPIREWLAANGRSIAPYARQAHEMLRQRDEAVVRNAAAAAASAAASSAVAVADGIAIPYSEAPPPAR